MRGTAEARVVGAYNGANLIQPAFIQFAAIGLLRFAFGGLVRYYETRPIYQLNPSVGKETWMNRAFLVTTLGALLVLTGGCKSKVNNNDAIHDGVVKHIASMNGLNVNNMTVTVTQATVNGDTAQASVDIRAKNGDPNAPPMQMVYQMQKQGKEWVVLKSQPTGGMQHPAPGEMPPQGQMPPGHPATGGQAPANHPDFNSILNTAQPPAQQQPQQPAPQQQQQAQKPAGGSSSKP